MRRVWLFGFLAALAIAAGFLSLTERPLTVTVVRPESDVALRIYGLGTVEARILSRAGFEVGGALTALAVDADDRVAPGQEMASLHAAEQEARVARAHAAVAANEASLAKAEAAVVRARAMLAQREAANRRQQGLAQRDIASIQRAEEAQRDEDVARADLAVAEADLAVIRVEGLDALPVTWGKSSDLKVGELAVALGSPLGTDFAGSVTAGIISGLDRRITVGDRSLQLIQTDAAINPGNSGGALVNSAGELVGINSAKIASSQVEGMGFAIPSDEAGPIVEQLITGQEVIRPALGISGSTITEEDSRRYSIPRGVYVQQVVPYGGADRAGLVRGDIITAIDGIPVETIEELVAQVGEKQVGDTVTLTITDRQNREKELEVVLSRQNTEE